MAGSKKELRNGRDECRDVGHAIGPDRFVSGNSYWQSHAVLETQESIVARSDDGLSPISSTLLSSLHVLVFSWPSFHDFSFRQEHAYILISAISNYPHKIRIKRNNAVQFRSARCTAILSRAKVKYNDDFKQRVNFKVK